ncbi:MAG: hypothetical protein KA796_02440 [Chryseobacterium sp.]|nr:hypothetical protein [Chryseobacterium sp.]MBP7498709.1 hypothetical protein [Chryseobacterium sp.]
MKFIRNSILILFLLSLSSCVSGIYEMARGYDNYVEINLEGRKELKKKKFKDEFKPEMADKINCEAVYHSLYENQIDKTTKHLFLIFYKTGQFAYFVSESKNANLDNLNKANFVGYYIINENNLVLETPTGNFNTAHYRVLWNFVLNGNTLVRNEKGIYKQLSEEFVTDDTIVVDRSLKPNW